MAKEKSDRSLLEVILVSILLQFVLRHADCSANSHEFLQLPGNKTVHEGDDVSFRCSLRSGIPFISAFVSWENGLTHIIRPSTNVTVLTSSNITTQIVTSDLIIHRVKRQCEGQMYKCSILLRFPNSSSVLTSSAFGRISVQFFLDDGDLQCSQKTEVAVLREGDHLSVKCEGPVGNPPIQIVWVGKKIFNLSILLNIVSEDSCLVSGNIIVTNKMHNKKLMCLATSHAFPGESRNCSIGPFKVFHLPEVRVIPNQADMIPLVFAELTLHCFANAFPAVDTYQWSCEPRHLISNCNSSNSDLTIHAIQVDSEDLVNVECKATNIIGSSSNNSVITITPITKGSIPECPLDTSTYSVNLDANLSYKHKGNSNNFQCNTVVEQKVDFRWYVDGYLYSEQGGKYVGIESSTELRMIAKSHIDIEAFAVVACEAFTSKSMLLRTMCFNNGGSKSAFPTTIESEVVSIHNNDSPVAASVTSDEVGQLPEDFLGAKYSVSITMITAIGTLFLMITSVLVILIWHKAKQRCGNHDCQTCNPSHGTRHSPDCRGSTKEDSMVVYDIPHYGSRDEVFLDDHAKEESEYDDRIYGSRNSVLGEISDRPTSIQASEINSSQDNGVSDVLSIHEDVYIDMSQRSISFVNDPDLIESVIGSPGSTKVIFCEVNSAE